MSDPEQWATFEQMGESEVRKRLAENRYGERTRPLVEEWLRRKEQERDDSLKREEMAIAHEAATAARYSADAARDSADHARQANRVSMQANKIAKIAIAVAATAAIISIIGIFSK